MGKGQQNLPIEEKLIEHKSGGKVVFTPALNKFWVQQADKNFCKYVRHPDPGETDFLENKTLWLEIAQSVVEDLEWLLRQEHHVFWSHMVYSMDAQRLILSFLQEAPPFYFKNEFPKDKEMEDVLSRAEHLTFLVLVRLSTKKESELEHVRNLGDLLYCNFLFTIPMFFDIFSIYGYKNRDSAAKLFEDVVSISPKYLRDLKEVPPFFLNSLRSVKDIFRVVTPGKVDEKTKLEPDLMKNVFLYLFDSVASTQIFFDINKQHANLMNSEEFVGEIAFFYNHIIPKINNFVKRTNINLFDSPKQMMNTLRLNLLSIVRTIFTCNLDDFVKDEEHREEHANEYLMRIMDILQEQLFISDYNKVYPIEVDLNMICGLCPNLDTVNLKYVQDGVTLCSSTKYESNELKDFRITSLISQVRDVLPDLGDGFVEFCLRYYDFNPENVITAIIEGNLPPNLDELDRQMQRPDENEHAVTTAEKHIAGVSGKNPEKRNKLKRGRVKSGGIEFLEEAGHSGGNTGNLEKAGTSSEQNQEMKDLFNDKTELQEIRDRILNLSLSSENYDDEYDDTYDDKSLFLKEAGNADEERRPDSDEVLGKESVEEEGRFSGDESASGSSRNFVENPADVRARLFQRRMTKMRRDFIANNAAEVGEKGIFVNRRVKNVNKSVVGNHNRKHFASRKRNVY